MSIIRLSNFSDDCKICGSDYVDNYSPNPILKEFFGARSLGASKCKCGGFTEFVDISEDELKKKIPFAMKVRSGYYSAKLPIGGWWGPKIAKQSLENFKKRIEQSKI